MLIKVIFLFITFQFNLKINKVVQSFIDYLIDAGHYVFVNAHWVEAQALWIDKYTHNFLVVAEEQLNQFDVEAIKLSAMGVTIVASSGDDGAVSSEARGMSSNCAYVANFPATSEYVLAAGATSGPGLLDLRFLYILNFNSNFGFLQTPTRRR